ncbi:MAG: nitroreductase family protein [Cellulosilyticaceae bacterium]
MKQEHIIQVDTKLCIGCGLCKKDCPVNNILMQDKKAVIKDQGCIKCAHCAAICPKAAVTLTGFDEAPIALSSQPTLDPNDLLMALKARRTIRQFKNKTVPLEIVQQVIEAGRVTPSAKNAQDVSYIILGEGKEKYEAVAVQFFRRMKPAISLVMKSAKEVTIDEDFFFKKAPVVVLVVTKDKISGALAASNMALMAESNGLGVLYSGFFTIVANRSRKLRSLLGLKSKEKVVTTLVMGYPDVNYKRTAQKESAVINYL